MIDVPSYMLVIGIAMMLVGGIGMWINNHSYATRENRRDDA